MRIAASDKVRPEQYNALAMASREMRETNDCAVKAVATVCGVSYEVAHATLEKFGRKNGKGAHTYQIHDAVEFLGKSTRGVAIQYFIQKYPKGHRDVLKNVTTHHMARFNNVWADGKTYLVYTKGHVLAVVNGVNHDWTVGSSKQVVAIYEVI